MTDHLLTFWRLNVCSGSGDSPNQVFCEADESRGYLPRTCTYETDVVMEYSAQAQMLSMVYVDQTIRCYPPQPEPYQVQIQRTGASDRMSCEKVVLATSPVVSKAMVLVVVS